MSHYTSGFGWVKSSGLSLLGVIFMSSLLANSLVIQLAVSADSPETLISDFDNLFTSNNVSMIYPSEQMEKPRGCSAAMVSDWAASAFIFTKLNTVVEGLDTDGAFVNQTTGKPIGAAGLGLISFGGPAVNPIVAYAESGATPTEDRAPVRFYKNASMFHFRLRNGTGISGANLSSSMINSNTDIFVIEVYQDGDGRNVMLCYGFGWKGTYAAGKYFDTEMHQNISSYTYNYVVVKWEDTNGNEFVDTRLNGDTYTVIATGLTPSSAEQSPIPSQFPSLTLLGAGARWAAPNGTKALYVNELDNWEAHHLTDGTDWEWFSVASMENWRLSITTALQESGFNVIHAGDIPNNLTNYDLVVLFAYYAVEPQHDQLIKNYLSNGGNIVIIAGTQCYFTQYSKQHNTYPAPMPTWFGAEYYINTGGSAYPAFDNPFGTSLLTTDRLFTGGYSHAGVDILRYSMAIAYWSSGGIFSFTHEYGQGRVYYQAIIELI